MSKPKVSIMDRVRGIFGNIISKAIFPAYMNLPGAEPRAPPFNLTELYTKVGDSWVMQQIFRVLLQETRRPGLSIFPRFVKKCKSCGTYYYSDIEECVCGSKEFELPKKEQRARLESILLHPNNDRESFFTILGSIIYHDLVADIWYVSVDYAPLKDSLVPREIKVQDPRYIKPVLDKFDRFSSNEYFCPRCFNDPLKFDNRGKYMITVNENIKEPVEIPCPECGMKMLQTAYIQEVNGEVTARWGKDQMVHGSTHRILPGFFGDPRSKSIWSVIHILSLMDQWFFDHFSESRLEKLIMIPGYNDAQIKDFTARLEKEKSKLEILDSRSGETRPKRSLRQVFLGGQQGANVLDIGIDPNKIQAMDFYRMGIQACAGLYGVQAIFIGLQQTGVSRNFTPALQMEVQERTILEIQLDKEQTLNGQLLPIFGITDWVLKFNPLEKKDKLREAEIEQRLSDAAVKYASLGFQISFDEQNNLKKSSKPILSPVGQGTPSKTESNDETIDTKTGMHELSPSTNQEINTTTTPREPHGKRPYSPNEEEEVP